MSDQLRLGDEAPAPTGRVRYQVVQHLRTKRWLAVEWSDGDPSGLSGPWDEPPLVASLPGLSYSRHRHVVRQLRDDIARRDTYADWIADEELAAS